jgi:ribonuclease D
MPETPILTTTAEIEGLAADLGRETVIAVDLEADSMHCYKEKVCLLQFSTPERTVLVDPLTSGDLSPLASVLADPDVRKIFHAADYDIRCLNRDFGFTLCGLFDTMIACQFLGEEKVGLADVLGKYYGVALDKQYQRADWAARPLTEGMIRYAAEDTRHLHRLARLLEEKLAARGRLEWVAEEFALLEQVRFQEQEGPLFLRAKGAAVLDRRQLAILEELLQWRDREARRRDRPLFKVLGNKTLLELARSMPRTLSGLTAVEGISPRLADRCGKALLGAIAAGLAAPESDLPVYPRGERRLRDAAVDRRLTALKEWRKEAAAELEMDPGIVINNALLEEIARRRPASPADLENVPGIKNWQLRVLGEKILETVANDV